MTSHPLIIIGSGLAGYMLAKELRKLDAQMPVIIITADDGAFYSKPLLSTALTQRKTPEQLVVTAAPLMAEELNAKIICQTRVTAIDPVAAVITLADHEKLKYSQLVLACGAALVLPSLTGDALQTLQTVNNLSDYHVFRQSLSGKKRIAILGAGLVGCEFGNDLINSGYAVTIIAPEQSPLMTLLPPVVGKLLEEKLAQAGVEWRLGHFATAINYRGEERVVTLADGQEILADVILSAAGLRPQIELARTAGIDVNRGIVVNRWQQTSFSNIFALGDCAEVDGLIQMYVAPLLQSARALAKILTGGRDPVHFPIMPVVVKTPVLPLVVYPSPAGIVGEWHIEGEGHHLRALFHDQNGQLRGFALAGDKIRDKLALAKQLPLVFSD
jgi:rubredoxin---NAD+ reductase